MHTEAITQCNMDPFNTLIAQLIWAKVEIEKGGTLVNPGNSKSKRNWLSLTKLFPEETFPHLGLQEKLPTQWKLPCFLSNAIWCSECKAGWYRSQEITDVSTVFSGNLWAEQPAHQRAAVFTPQQCRPSRRLWYKETSVKKLWAKNIFEAFKSLFGSQSVKNH